jgi:hypothetical protein
MSDGVCRAATSVEEGYVSDVILEIEDDVMMFMADGQHRREGIKLDTSIGLQHVPVIFVPFKGKRASRQLFRNMPPKAAVGRVHLLTGIRKILNTATQIAV